MPSFTAAEAQAQLDELIDLALTGEKVFIRRGHETFELTAYTDKNEIAAGRNRVMAMMRAGAERAKRKTE